LEHGTIEPLNETWANDGREPLQLEAFDDGMPDLEDPRLERCVRDYIEKHAERLQKSLEDARTKWEQMCVTPVDVEGTMLMPGQRLRVYYAKDGVREHARDDGERVFLGYGSEPGRHEKQLPSRGARPIVPSPSIDETIPSVSGTQPVVPIKTAIRRNAQCTENID